MNLQSTVEKFASSKFMKSLEKFSEKLQQNNAFLSLATGMASTMGLIMIGAVIQIICSLGGLIFGWQAGQPFYDSIYMVYRVTMGLMGFFMCFSLAYSYAKNLGLAGLQQGFIALVCYILVVSLPQNVTVGETSFTALNLDALGTGGIFVALLIGMLSVKISKFVIDHKMVIRLPESVPSGVIQSFNAIIPAGINIIIWYGLSIGLSTLTGGMLTLSTLITYGLSIPLKYLTSPVGVFILIVFAQLFWFFGIHGNTVVYAAIIVPYIAAYTTNAELAAQGQPLVFNAIFLYAAVSFLGGSGNTLPLVLMGLRSKSKSIKSICTASFVPALFNINEPVIFGLPIMYNPILLIPFILCPVVCGILFFIAYQVGIIALPQVLIMSSLPVLISEFMITLSFRNVIFAVLLIPVCALVWYPFFKIYERQCLEKENEKENEILKEGV